MNELTFKQRLWLTVLLCGVIVGLGQVFAPPPPPLERSATGDTSSGGEVDEKPIQDESDPIGRAAEPQGTVGATGSSSRQHESSSHRIGGKRLAISVGNAADGLIQHVDPLAEQFRNPDGAGIDFIELGELGRTLELGFDASSSDFNYDQSGNLEVVEQSATRWQVRDHTDSVSVEQTLEIELGYASRYTVAVTNSSSRRQRHRLRVTLRQGQESADTYNLHRALCHRGLEEGVESFELDDTEDAPATVDGGVGWVAVDSKYFLQALVPDGVRGSCRVTRASGEAVLENSFLGPVVELEPNEQRSYRFGLYLGAKEQSELAGFAVVDDALLEDAVDWGWFGGMSRTVGQWMLELLRYFHRLTGIWGVAILLLTVVVKLVTLPLTLKQMNSMKRMREISPELDQLRKKYAKDRAKQQQEMQALFSRTGVNPLAGCFPALVQMPIWIALYAMLGTVVELYHEPFLWLPDLTRPDPYFALPVAMGALMFLQMRVQPMSPTQDPTQAKMMQWMMPAFFTFMILFVPSGLGVYIFSNVLLSLVQTMIQLRPSSGSTAPSGATK